MKKAFHLSVIINLAFSEDIFRDEHSRGTEKLIRFMFGLKEESLEVDFSNQLHVNDLKHVCLKSVGRQLRFLNEPEFEEAFSGLKNLVNDDQFEDRWDSEYEWLAQQIDRYGLMHELTSVGYLFVQSTQEFFRTVIPGDEFPPFDLFTGHPFIKN